MSIARHHNEWLNLVEVSGPFVTLPVLQHVFPQGLESVDAEVCHVLRLTYAEWADNQGGTHPDYAIHTQWVRYVLANLLDMSLYEPRATQSKPAGLVTGTSLPQGVFANFPEYSEQLHPDYALIASFESMPRLLIKVYNYGQDLNQPIEGARWPATPAERMMYLLRYAGVRLGLITNGRHWMLVDAPRNETTGYITWDADLWFDESLTIRAFRSLLRLGRFYGDNGETLENMLKESVNYQQELTDQLGYQVRRAVEVLVQSLDRLDSERRRTLLADLSEGEVYEAALTVMMRLVFLLAAEERKLLPLGEPLYDNNYAASTLLGQLQEKATTTGEEYLEHYYDAWSRLLALFRLVYAGTDHQDLNLRAYDGRLFDPDRFPFLEGRENHKDHDAEGSWRTEEAQPLLIDNRTVLHLLEALQFLKVSVAGVGTEMRRLSFRALDVEQIGHVYEGLLDHTLRRATEPMLSLFCTERESVEVALSALEEQRAKSDDELLTSLQKITGRSTGALLKALAYVPDSPARDRLLRACGNDVALLMRVLPFAGLVRGDSFGRPFVIPAGALYMTQGMDRRSTGTHYTPRTLTEPLVQHALDPLVYIGPAEGLPADKWRLRPAAEILDLKVCDMAMGSGAFLVQACRYLAQKLVLAWEDAEWQAKWEADEPVVLTAPLGQPATGAPGEILLPKDGEERLALAKCCVAERCLYGVDKNPLAVEMAKLSLWLTTLDKNRPFTFLDHALRCGDSLLGVNLKQLSMWSMNTNIADDEIRQKQWVETFIGNAVTHALSLRRQMRQLPDDSLEHVLKKAKLLKEAEQAMAVVKLGADLLIASILADYQKPKPNDVPTMPDYYVLVKSYDNARHLDYNEHARAEIAANFATLRTRVDALLGDRNPYHWPLELPEVFAEQVEVVGFSVITGNPPFQGGQRITGILGTDYRDYLVDELAMGQRGSADLCAYFFLRATGLAQQGGMAALVATNTIAQGDTREVGLDQIVSSGWTIPRAVPTLKWPGAGLGAAGVEIAEVWLRNGVWKGKYMLNDVGMHGITPFLTEPGKASGKPYTLYANANKSFQGSIVLGKGFVLEPEEAQALIEKNPRNKDVLFPYLNGEDLNSRYDQSPSRWVINFRGWPLEKAEEYPDCLNIVREKVKPERDQNNRKVRRERWWQHAERASGLYSTIADMKRVIVRAQVSRTHALTFFEPNIVFSMMVIVLALESYEQFVILQSNLHEAWVNKYSSSLKSDQRYTPSDCFETFPFPSDMEGLDEIGERYYRQRQAIMLARQEGLTKTYNRFHDPQEADAGIVQLRALHRLMDEAVARAYGWDDLALAHDFHETKQGVRYTISEEARREVLDRLLLLNHERHAEELRAGLLDGKKARKGKAGKNGRGGKNGKQERNEPGDEPGQEKLF